MSVLPRLFDMNIGRNQSHLKDKGYSELHEKIMKTDLWDLPFEQFVVVCDNYK